MMPQLCKFNIILQPSVGSGFTGLKVGLVCLSTVLTDKVLIARTWKGKRHGPVRGRRILRQPRRLAPIAFSSLPDSLEC